MRSQESSSLGTAHHKLLLRIIGFRRKDRTGYKALSYGKILERTGSERIETTFRKRQFGFTGTLIRQGDSRLSKRAMFGWMVVQGPTRGGRPVTSWVECLRKNREAFGAVPRAKAKDGSVSHLELLSWMDGRTGACRIWSCCQGWTALDDCCKKRGHVAPGASRGERKHSITPGDAQTFANPTCGASARLVDLYSS